MDKDYDHSLVKVDATYAALLRPQQRYEVLYDMFIRLDGDASFNNTQYYKEVAAKLKCTAEEEAFIQFSLNEPPSLVAIAQIPIACSLRWPQQRTVS